VVFLPNILLLFLAIALLEDSGYMARAAFLMDRYMHRIGLHGKSFIPMLIGFGCSVPAILATRTLETRRDRLVTMLVVPLMSCGARLTIYALFIPAFFPPHLRAPVLWLIYLIGIVLAVVCAKLLRGTVLRGRAEPFVIELPLYRLPTIRGLIVHMWDRGWMYLRKAGTVILAISVILWVLSSFPKKTRFDRDYAAEARAARAELVSAIRPIAAKLAGPDEADALAAAAAAEIDRRIARPSWLKTTANAAESRPVSPAATSPATAASAAAPRGGSMAAVLARSGPLRQRYRTKLRRLAETRQAEELMYSAAGRIGRGLEYVIRPLGFDWRIGTAMIGALAAKEVFVAQMAIVFSVGGEPDRAEALRARLRETYTPLQAFCIMLFMLISAPCAATIACTWKESGSWKWGMFQLGGLTVLAYLVTLAVYQVGRLIT
ncbi:MAG: ferrous iron transporter B, partial [Planctomycetes bacterium]|nr:ferrous iron transporter B [Planctomycetota bacterium]